MTSSKKTTTMSSSFLFFFAFHNTTVTCFIYFFPAHLYKMSPSKKSNLGFAESFILSGTAAAISKTSAAPIERVKLLLQNQNELLKQGKLSAGYNGVKDCVSRTLKHEGLVSFWRGNFASVVRYFPQQALNFGFKDQVIYIPTHISAYTLLLCAKIQIELILLLSFPVQEYIQVIQKCQQHRKIQQKYPQWWLCRFPIFMFCAIDRLHPNKISCRCQECLRTTSIQRHH